MLGVDTNVLVRFVTRDDETQAPQARALFGSSVNQPIHICTIALVELAWVLGRVKRRPSADVLAACRALLSNPVFKIERAALVRSALDAAEAAKCDVADAIIALVNAEAGCETTATFDGNAQRLDGMVSVESRL